MIVMPSIDKDIATKKLTSSFQENNTDYTAAIRALRYLSDINAGVQITHTEDGKLIRDTGSANERSPRIEENYLVHALNTLRATKTLIELAYSPDEEKVKGYYSKIDTLAKNLVVDRYAESGINLSKNECLNILKEANDSALAMLKEAKVGKISHTREGELLAVARHYASLDDDHPDIMTVIEVGEGNYYAQNSKKLCQLTDVQKTKYEDLPNQEWFKSLPTWKQKLVEKYKDKIIGGKHLIPTQIRDIPGIRNGYTTAILKCDNDFQKTEELYKFTQSGTVATFSSHKEIALENLQQLLDNSSQSFADKPLHFFTLNTNSRLDLLERECVTQTQKSVDDIQAKGRRVVKHSNTPINMFRTFFGGDYNDLKQSLSNIASAIHDESNILAVKNFLQGNAKYSDVALGEIENEPEKNFLSAAVELKRLINRYEGFLGKFYVLKDGVDNASLKVIRQFAVVQNQLQQLQSKNIDNPLLNIKGIQGEQVHIACKSGKDRTGLVTVALALDTIKGSVKGVVEEKSLAQSLSSAGHIQYLASISGGVPGCIGVKSLPFSIPKVFGEKFRDDMQLPNAVLTGEVGLVPLLRSKFVDWIRKEKIKNDENKSQEVNVKQEIDGMIGMGGQSVLTYEEINKFVKSDLGERGEAVEEKKASLWSRFVNWVKDLLSSNILSNIKKSSKGKGAASLISQEKNGTPSQNDRGVQHTADAHDQKSFVLTDGVEVIGITTKKKDNAQDNPYIQSSLLDEGYESGYESECDEPSLLKECISNYDAMEKIYLPNTRLESVHATLQGNRIVISGI